MLHGIAGRPVLLDEFNVWPGSFPDVDPEFGTGPSTHEFCF